MARFDKLEFDPDGPTPPASAESPQVEKDERYWSAMAVGHRRSGHYENALRFYSRALEIDKSLVAAWVGQVQMLIQLHEYPQASLWSKKALEIFPVQPELMAAQAQSECRRGNLKSAYALSDGALKQTGESAYRWQVRGELIVANKQRNDRHCFDRAEIADADWLVPLESSLIYTHYRQHANALLRAQRAAEKEPSAPYAWYVLGCCQLQTGLETPARQSLTRCVELSPGHREAQHRLSELGQRTGSLAGFLRRLIHR